MCRHRQPCQVEEVVVLDATQLIPPPAISKGGRNPQRGEDAGELLKILALSVTYITEEGQEDSGDDDNNNNSKGDKEAEEDKKNNTEKKSVHYRDIGHHRRKLQRRLGLSPSRRSQITASHCGATLYLCRQTRAYLVPLVV